ncbi:MAG: MerR family transcriptional regulator [Clostridia bacterium]|nr:MerR family transcriptional regulator [Clostridia bacterium]
MIYSSRDVACETGMTTEGLRFYEKSGILKVNKDSQNGYRQYEIQRVPFLRMAKILNTYGISLSEIGTFFGKGDEGLPMLLDAMSQKKTELTDELWRKHRILERLEYQQDLVRRTVEDPSQLWFCNHPALAYLEYYGAEKIRGDRELQNTVRNWVAQMPITYPVPVLLSEDIGNATAYCHGGFICNVSDMERLGLEMNRFVRMIPAQQYICCISPQGKEDRIETEPTVTQLIETANKMNLSAAGDVYFMSFAVTAQEDNVPKLYYQIMLPVSIR